MTCKKLLITGAVGVSLVTGYLSAQAGIAAFDVGFPRLLSGSNTDEYHVRGIVETVDIKERTVSVSIAPFKTAHDGTIVKFTVPQNAVIERGKVNMTADNVLVFDAPVPSSLEKMTTGDSVDAALFLRRGSLTATYVVYHDSLPPLP